MQVGCLVVLHHVVEGAPLLLCRGHDRFDVIDVDFGLIHASGGRFTRDFVGFRLAEMEIRHDTVTGQRSSVRSFGQVAFRTDFDIVKSNQAATRLFGTATNEASLQERIVG